MRLPIKLLRDINLFAYLLPLHILRWLNIEANISWYWRFEFQSFKSTGCNMLVAAGHDGVDGKLVGEELIILID